MPRVLLVLPTATYRADAFLAAAERLGVEVVTASERPQALASVMGDRFLEVPLDDAAESARRIVELSGRRGLDAVVAVDDQGLLTAALAGEALGLPHNPPAAVAATRDKVAMRTLLARAGVRQPAFLACEAADGAGMAAALAGAAAAAAERLGGPVVVKPTGLSGSRGVIRADDPAAARAAAERVAALLARLGEPGRLLVEAYVPGDEVALEALLHHGELVPLALFDKPDPLVGPFFEESIYVTPSRHPAPVQDAVAGLVGEAAAALGLTEGPVHAEVRLPGGDEAPVLIELASRTIGGRCAAALRFAADASLEELVLAEALGKGLPTALAPGSSGVMMLPIPRSGRLVAVDGQDRAAAVPGITAVEVAVPAGAKIEALPEGDRYLGFLFARGAGPGEVETALRTAQATLEVRIAAVAAGEVAP